MIQRPGQRAVQVNANFQRAERFGSSRVSQPPPRFRRGSRLPNGTPIRNNKFEFYSNNKVLTGGSIHKTLYDPLCKCVATHGKAALRHYCLKKVERTRMGKQDEIG